MSGHGDDAAGGRGFERVVEVLATHDLGSRAELVRRRTSQSQELDSAPAEIFAAFPQDPKTLLFAPIGERDAQIAPCDLPTARNRCAEGAADEGAARECPAMGQETQAAPDKPRQEVGDGGFSAQERP